MKPLGEETNNKIFQIFRRPWIKIESCVGNKPNTKVFIKVYNPFNFQYLKADVDGTDRFS